ncbi:MAG: ABC transporter permease [Caldilineaceae bacterium]|nr:ABC transporter permease [Caldilineaceae bacterium]MBP8107608.1 ABC transporter permease [Caldilineaceae bacterium]MBP8124092.1 ABC transporter permease [Caldilineaceae bacterium]MBP9072489.1 ABC transporter permease [Caldilineaceae bacterium]
MTTYIIRRLLWLIPTLFFVALITFVLMHATPGGPWDRDLSARQVDARTQELLNKEFGLDKPLFINTEGGNPLDSQFFNYIAGALQGDLGPSYRQRGMNVEDILFKAPEGKPFWDSKFGYSMRLGLLSLIMAVAFGIPLGVIGALRRNTIVDYFSLLISTIGISVPNFVLAILLIILVAGKLKLIKIVQQDWSSPAAWIIPALILGFGTFAFITRLTRSQMLEVMQQDYVLTARSKGLSGQAVVVRHMLRNALIPVITIIGPALAGLVTGSFIIELMFAFPGSGREFVQSISRRDYSMIMGTTLLYAVLVAVANLTVDIMYAFLDPRIKLGE